MLFRSMTGVRMTGILTFCTIRLSTVPLAWWLAPFHRPSLSFRRSRRSRTKSCRSPSSEQFLSHHNFRTLVPHLPSHLIMEPPCLFSFTTSTAASFSTVFRCLLYSTGVPGNSYILLRVIFVSWHLASVFQNVDTTRTGHSARTQPRSRRPSDSIQKASPAA